MIFQKKDETEVMHFCSEFTKEPRQYKSVAVSVPCITQSVSVQY